LQSIEASNRWHQLILLIILLLACFLRLYGLENESLWNDELSSFSRSNYDTLRQVIIEGVIPDVHPPGYQILLFYVEKYIGISPTSLRLPSAIAGSITVLITFLIGRQLFSWSVGLFASGLLSVSPMHIWLSQEARPYAILILLVSLSVYLSLLLFKEKKHKWQLIQSSALITVFVFLEYLHYFGFLFYLLLVFVLLIYCIIKKYNLLLISAISLLPLLAYFPWLPYALQQASGESYVTSPSIFSIVYLFIEYLGWSKPLLACFVVSFCYAVFRIALHGKLNFFLFNKSNILIPVLWLLLPLIISFSISLFLVPIFTIRNMMIAIPAVYILFALSIYLSFSNPILRIATFSAVFILFLFTLLFIRKHYTIPHRNQFREAAEFVATNTSNQSHPVIVASAWNKTYFDYYFDRMNCGLATDILATGPEHLQEIQETLVQEQSEDLWLLWGHLEPDGALIDSLTKMFLKPDYESFLGLACGIFRTDARVNPSDRADQFSAYKPT
jgi:mannosyltransferase